MLIHYIKIAARSLLKNRLYSAIKLIGLTASCATCLLIGLYLHHELGYDRCHRNAERIVRMDMEYRADGETTRTNVTGSKAGPAFARDFPEVEASLRVMQYKEVVRRGAVPQEEPNFYYADSTFFRVFTFPLLKGNPATALTAPHSVVLSERTARRYFGEKDPLGQVLHRSGGRKMTVTGVMAEPPANSHLKPEFVCAFTGLAAARPENESWRNANYATYLLLHKADQIESVQARIPAYMASKRAETRPENDGDYLTFHLTPLPDMHLHATVPGNFEPNGDVRYLYLLGITALLILLIAVGTYVNLTIAAGTDRAREIGVHQVLGAGRSQLAVRYFGESALATFVALTAGLALAGALLPLFNTLFERQLSMAPLYQTGALLLLVGAGLTLSLLAGFYPALVLSRFRLAAVLKGRLPDRPGRWSVRNAATVLQFFVSIVLLACTLSLRNQLDFIENKEIGFGKEHVLVLPAETTVNEKFDVLRRRFLQHPEVESVTRSYDSPAHIRGEYRIGKSPTGADEKPVTALPAGPGFPETMQIELLAGADLEPGDMDLAERARTDSSAVLPLLINASQARAFGWTPEEAVGKQVHFFWGTAQIKGVTRDFHFASLHEPVTPLVIFPGAWGQVLLVKMRGNDPKSTIRYLEQTWTALVPEQPFKYHFLDDELRAMYAAERQTARVVTTFSGLAIVLACLGLFGLASYRFVQRTREVGIRRILGAGTAGIVRLLTTDFLKLVFIAFLSATPVAWYLIDHWLQDFAYRAPIAWWAFAASGLVAVAVALLTMSAQGIRTALANPVESLRSE